MKTVSYNVSTAVTAVTAVTESRDVKCKELQSSLGSSKMSNKKYRCPYCEQTSSRRWNLLVHLERRHQGAGQPVGPSQTGPTFNDQPPYGNEPTEKISGRLNKNDLSSYNRGNGRGENIDNVGNSLDDTVKNLRRIAEIQRLTKELNSQHNQLPLHLMPSIGQTSINFTEQFLQILGSMTFKPENNPLKDHIIGLRCHTCEKCLSTVPLLIYGLKESGMIVPSRHKCNSTRVANFQGLTGLDRRSKVMELYRLSPETMKKSVQDMWLGGVSPHLIVIPLIPSGKDTYEFAPQVLKDHQWLSIAIEKEEIKLDDKYFDEFMSFTKGNTFIKFSILGADTTRHVSSYFLTLSKEPFLPFKFIIEIP